MQVISRRPFYSAETRYPNQRQALSDVYRILKQAHFESPDEMRKVFKSLDNFKYKSKRWVINISGNHLRLIAFIKSGIPWRAIKPHLDDTMEKARELWPEALEALPMDEAHKEGLRAHWGKLQDDFKIKAIN